MARSVSIKFTPAELRALFRVADEGAEGILTADETVDFEGGDAFVDAAHRALEKLREALAKSGKFEFKSRTAAE